MTRLGDIGEKRLIAEIVAPLFNPHDDPAGVGDDCAAILVSPGHDVVASTDRVPADLIAFRLGILDYRGLGDYLGRLNLSDIAACGGRPLALLFNAGLPAAMYVGEFEEVCRGLLAAVGRAGCRVLGGDVSLSEELSLSATVLGIVPSGRAVTRRGATPGDAIIATRALGLTPTAFSILRSEDPIARVSDAERATLRRQFTDLEPLVELGVALREAGATSLMDNTDGVGQSLFELAHASRSAFVVERERVNLQPLVERVASACGQDPVIFALGAGADFSLVGTIAPGVLQRLPAGVVRIGTVECGEGLWLRSGRSRARLKPNGWDHFATQFACAQARTAA